MRKLLLGLMIISVLGVINAQNTFEFSHETITRQWASSVSEEESGDIWVLVQHALENNTNFDVFVLDSIGNLKNQFNIPYDTLYKLFPTDLTRLGSDKVLLIGERRRIVNDTLESSIEIQLLTDSFELIQVVNIAHQDKPFYHTRIFPVNDSTAVFTIINLDNALFEWNTVFGLWTESEVLFSDTILGNYTQVERAIEETGFISSSSSYHKVILLDDSLKLIADEFIPNLGQHVSSTISSGNSYLLFHAINSVGITSTNYTVQRLDSDLNSIGSVQFGLEDINARYELPNILTGMDLEYENYIFTSGFYPVIIPQPPSEPPYSSVIQIANLDSNLNIRWFKMYGGDAYYRPYDIVATSDTGCIVAGYRYDTTGVRHSDFHVLKIGSDGESPLVSVEDEKPVPYDITVYPNPSSGLFMVRIGQRSADLRLQMTDMQGKQVLITKLRNRENQFDLSHLVPGTYLYSVFDKNRLLGSSQWVKF